MSSIIFFTHKTFTGLTFFFFESAKMFPSVLSSGVKQNFVADKILGDSFVL